MKRIAFRLFVIVTVGVLAIKASNAFFSDRETSTANHFTAGKLDLKVNDQDNPSGIVTLSNMEAGDDRIATKTLFVDNNPAKVFLHLNDLIADQGEQTESEETEESQIGPKFDIQNFMTYDLVIGDLTIITSNSATPLADAASCWIPLGTIPGSTSVPMLQSFHFDQAVTDWAQGDTLSFTEEFLAQQVNDPTTPVTGTGRAWSNQLKKCVSDISPLHNFAFTCTSGCSGTYLHTLNISSMDTATGNFSGTGFYNPNNAYTWTISGHTEGNSFSAHIVYTGLGSGYTIDSIGTIDTGGTISGTATSASQLFTFLLN